MDVKSFRSAMEQLQQRAQMLLAAAHAPQSEFGLPRQGQPRQVQSTSPPSMHTSPVRRSCSSNGSSKPASPMRGLDAAAQGSYLDTYLKRNQMLTTAKAGFYSPPFERPVSILTHAKRPGNNTRNRDTVEEQYQRDMGAFERTAHKYRKHSSEQCHHHRPQEADTSLWNQGYVASKGLGKVRWEGSDQQYDPITGQYKPVPVVAGKPRPSSAPPCRPSDPERYTRQLAAAEVNQGVHNPLTHTWLRAPDAQLEAQHRKASDRVHGFIGIAARQDGRGIFDPVRGVWQAVPHAKAPQADAAAPGQHSGLAGPAACAGKAAPAPPSAAAAAAEAEPSSPKAAAAEQQVQVPRQPEGPQALERPRSASVGRRPAAHGDSWGSYNPLTHQWIVPPRNSKFVDQDAVTAQQVGLSGHQLKKVQRPPTQGVYNPITNSWLVPPVNKRIIEGLSFSPASLFKVARPVSAITAQLSIGCSR